MFCLSGKKGRHTYDKVRHTKSGDAKPFAVPEAAPLPRHNTGPNVSIAKGEKSCSNTQNKRESISFCVSQLCVILKCSMVNNCVFVFNFQSL